MATDTYARIDRLLTRAERHIAAVFQAMIDALRDQLADPELIADLLEGGDFERAFLIIEKEAARLGAASNLMVVRSGDDTMAFLRSAGVANLAFDQVNQRAVATMQANRLELIRQFTEGQRATLRQVMVDAMTDGIHPTEQARRFREVVGLTDYQARANANFRRMLERVGQDDARDQAAALTRELRDKRFDSTIRRAIADRQPLTRDQINKMVEANARKAIKLRAETIARTEALRSVHQGTLEAFQQAIDAGELDADQIEQKWVSARDGRVRDSHARLNGQTRAMGETWQGNEGSLRYPGDPSAPAAEVINCRCVVVRRIKPPIIGG